MCYNFLFFDFFFFYFLLLVFATIFRKEITYKGVFVLLNSLLFFFTLYLVWNFTTILLFNVITDFHWDFNINIWHSLEVAISLRCDPLSYLFVLLVTIIGMGTNFYVLNYFKYEANEDIFTLLINWFMFSMMILVLADNLFTLFLGWESIGLSSFFLINFWSTRRGTVKSSFKAFFFNKISDFFLFIALVLINYTFYCNNLALINLKVVLNILNITYLYESAVLFLFCCTLFKSAQLIGHLWLPDSMEAPVPASALIHSATLVSAGIYLLLRFTPLIVMSNLHLLSIAVGSITAAYGAIVSASQTDMKKLLAYSTISHCGFLFVTIGTELYMTSIIYLFLHGLFKALTFFCAGSFIRVSGSQDTRLMGNLSRILPVDTIFLIICAFNLGGLPFSLGYLYKSVFITSFLQTNTLFVFLGLCSIGLLSSVVYVYRLVYYSAFDITKELFMNLLYEMQQKQINVVRHWSLTTPVQIIAVYLVFFFSCVIYVYFVNYFSFSHIKLDHQPITLTSDSVVSSEIPTLYKSFYEFFYSLYPVVAISILVVGWRQEYTYLFRLNFMLHAVLFSFFLTIYSSLLNLIKMWGHILTEASTQQNFNFGFSTYKSEILIHLSQWQYWWWFWFSLWWALYYFIILRTMTKRTFNFNIAMNTSIRGRGKWGDFLVALIPLSWCCNILINSNFILRMIEWQNESSLFTIRIQGKQWYWVYKYDPNTAQAVMSTPKNIGHNRWRVVSGQESYNADTYYQAIHLASHLEFQDSYSKFTKKIETHKKNLLNLSLSNEKVVFKTTWTHKGYNPSSMNKFLKSQENFNSSDLRNDFKGANYRDQNNYTDVILSNYDTRNKKVSMLETKMNTTLSYFYKLDQNIFTENFFTKLTLDSQFNAYYDFLQLDETSDADSNTRHFLTTQPFRLLKGVLNQHVIDLLRDSNEPKVENKLLFLNTKFSLSGESLKDKELMPETLWGFRQKKYKRMKKFKFKPEVIYDPVTFQVIGNKALPDSPKIDIAGLHFQNVNITSTTSIENEDTQFKNRIKNIDDTFNYRLSSQINRHRSELVPVTLARRLLRTKRTLVLPAHVNLTLITNSYDVVHSWFVPGLGLKIDCVPGRSTHHTFYIDNIGFYYGQCAEICGRYHHHMPIRLCALPFEHFVVWWQSKGLARMNRTSEINANKYTQHTFNNPVTREKLIYRMN